MARSIPQQRTNRKSLKDEPEFQFFVQLYRKMNEEKDVDKLEDVDGVQGLACALGVDVNYGIDIGRDREQLLSVEDRREVFGSNDLNAFKTRTTFAWTKELLRSHMMTPLIILAIINTILVTVLKEERENVGWIDDIGILLYVFICIVSGLAMDYHHFRAQRVLNRETAMFNVTVVRDGREQLIKNLEVLVGDILVLTKDVTIAADGVLFVDNNLFVNEEVVTGESEPIKKKLVEDPFCLSGTRVTNGSGRILVTAVGEDSEESHTLKEVSDSTNHAEYWTNWIREDSGFLNLVALCLGVLSFVILLIGWLVGRKGYPISEISDEGPVHFLILPIAIMVVELPYWPLLIRFFGCTYQAWKCAKDNIILHTPRVVPWMALVDSICFDKTGTLTEDKMTVVKGWFQGTSFDRIPKVEELDSSSLELITENVGLNSEAFLNIEEDGTVNYVGNQTECALLVMAKNFGVDYVDIRKHKRQNIMKNYGFDSNRRMSSVIVKCGDLLRLYNKGATEMVLSRCTKYIDSSGFVHSISQDKCMELKGTIKTMAAQGLRTLAMTYTDLDPKDFNFSENGVPLNESVGDKGGFAKAPEDDLVLLAIVGIKDPIREGVLEVVEELRKAGIIVKMMTGDHLETAKQVARECGILTDGITMEGAEFRRMDEEEEYLLSNLSKLQVLARASPHDKHRLVELLEKRWDVAVCGDGTNDARAMKTSVVGIAMGTNSTEVARKAAHVVILNDKISSILSLYMSSRCNWLARWGYKHFRITATLVVWIVVLVSICVAGDTPLNAPQFLWTIFIMDILVLLTFITVSPPSRVPDGDSYQTSLDPTKRDLYYVHILLQALYQIIVIVCTFCSLSSLFERYAIDEDDTTKMRKNSLMFNIFVFMQLFNSLNCRKVFGEYNVFEGLFSSPLSCTIRLITISLQLMVMLTPVGTMFKVTELDAWEWLYSISVSVAVIPLSTFIRYDSKKKIIDFESRLKPIVRALRERVD